MSTFLRLSALTFLVLARVVSSAEPGDVEIQHDPIQCWPTDQFLFVDSFFEPPVDLQTAKVYFRSSVHPDYYFAEMTLGRDGGGRAIVPMADAQTPEVVYYVELVTNSYSAFRTSEMTVPVSSGSECKRRDPEAAFYNGPNPDMTVGATRAGASQIPPGFQSNGISRFISITGPGGGGGGGVSGKTIGIIAGVGGGTAAVFAFTGSSDATTSEVGGVTTVTTTAGATTTVTGGGPSSTTTTVSGGGPSSTTTTVVGGPTTTTTIGPSTTTTTGGPSTTTTTGGPSTTTTTGGPSTTTSVGSTTTSTGSSSTTTSGGSSTTTSAGSSTTTAASTTTTTPPSTTTTSAGSANFRITKSDDTDPVPRSTSFNYFLDIDNIGGSGATVNISDPLPAGVQVLFISNGSCRLFGSTINCVNIPIGAGQSLSIRIQVRSPSTAGIITNRATLTWPAGSVSDAETTNVSPLRDPDSSAEPLVIATFLDIEPYDGSARGRVIFNESQSLESTNTSPMTHRVQAVGGENRVEASVLQAPQRGGFWRFDFSGARRFVPGSIQVDSGQVYSQDGRSIVFAVTPNSLLRFRFQVETER